MTLENDVVVASAVLNAAAAWYPKPGDPEGELARALAVPLRARVDGSVSDEGRRGGFEFRNWNPFPRGVDLVVRNSRSEPRVVFELKHENVGEVLYDIYKLISLREIPCVESAYSIVAATTGTWARNGDCVELFNVGVGERRRFDSLDLFDRYEEAWCQLRGWKDERSRNSSGCPTRIPQHVEIKGIAAASANGGTHEVRCVSVSGAGGWLPFDGDWPAAFVPKIGIPPVYRRRTDRPRQLYPRGSQALDEIELAGYPVPRTFRGMNTDRWLAAHVPKMSDSQYQALVTDLVRRRAWKPWEIEKRVVIHRSG